MKPGEAKVGQRVRTLIAFAAYPDVLLGSRATILEVIAQHPGAETDAVLIQPEGWPANTGMPCQSKDLTLEEDYV